MKFWIFVTVALSAQAQVSPTKGRIRPQGQAVLPQPIAAYYGGQAILGPQPQQLPGPLCAIYDPWGNLVSVIDPNDEFTQRTNRGLPGIGSDDTNSVNLLPYGQSTCGGNQPTRLFNPAKNFGKQQQSAAPSTMPNLGSALQGLAGGNGAPTTYADNSSTSLGDAGGSSGGGNEFSSQSVGNRPKFGGQWSGDGLCVKDDKKPTTQTKPQPPNQLSWCDTIYNTLKDYSRGPNCIPSTGELVDKLADPSREIRGMEEFCPGWARAKGDPEKRRLIMMNFIAAMVTAESSWNPATAGDGGRSKGLLQLTAATDRAHGCACQGLVDEHNPIQNLQCGTHMIVKFMARDGVVGTGSTDRDARGVARSFGPFRERSSSQAARNNIKGQISNWCRNSLNLPGGSGAAPGLPSTGAPAPTFPLKMPDDPRFPKGAR